MGNKRRRIGMWLLRTDQDHQGRIVLSAKRKRGGYLRKTGWALGNGDILETNWRYYPLKPYEHTGFDFIGYL